MPKTIREQIMDRVALRLAKITINNGYRTNAGQKVIYGQLSDPIPATLPMFHYYDGLETYAPEFGTDARCLKLTIEGFDRVKQNDFTAVANIMRADIEKALYIDHQTGMEDWTFGDLVQKITFDQSSPWIFPHPTMIGGIASDFLIIYRQVLGNPYAQDG